MTKVMYICIDDTDTENSIGTGRLARYLSEKIEKEGMGKVEGITRHQLLLDKDVPYTSNNGNACLEVHDFKPAIYELAVEFMKSHFVLGSDPGLCICPDEMVTQEIIQFGHLAQREVLLKDRAHQIAHQAGVFLRELGGTGQGVIGALAGIGLRATGNDGRFIELSGTREIMNKITIKEILEQTPIKSVVDPQGNQLPATAVIDPVGWLRPYLRNGEPTLIVAGPIAKGIKGDAEGCYLPVKL